MAAERLQWRLTTILAADVVGFSRLVRADEEATLAALNVLRAEIIAPKIAERGGRIFKLMGDGILAEFPSVVEAVRAATEIQRAVAERGGVESGAPPIEFRIGVNLGDVVVDGDDLQGDGVNLASRLEGLADAGGLSISAQVYEQVRDRLDLTFEDVGDRTVKNIDRPIRVWRWAPEATSKTEGPGTGTPVREKPSIAVMPFANIGGDPEQDYFADGMVEEIITDLARVRWLTVIARNSTLAYKGRTLDVRRVGRELAVRYVVEGAVRRVGGALRITTRLTDAETGGHLWADKFTGSLEEVFDLQDQITLGVVAAIEPSVRRAEIERAKRKRTESLDAYDLYLRALEQAYIYTPAARSAGLELLEAAIALDPGYAEAHGVAAYLYQQRYLWGGREPNDRLAAIKHAEAVAAVRTEDATSLAFAAMVWSALDGRHDAALVTLERALELNPSSAVAHVVCSLVNMILGRPERSASHAERSLRLSPFDPLRHISHAMLAVANLAAQEPEAALTYARKSVDAHPLFAPGITTLALCLVALGRLDEARQTIRRLLEIAPDTCVATLHERYLPTNGLGLDRVVADLRAAGLPE